ncbi:MAG: alkaline phosphatase family protein [Labilithrix sp.]|nr:alkaline phosphatase family protein [Labilithrix sp.]MCW5817502.1 alkaline phosphatase family protein [Labilithrix sp.]
MRRVFPLVFALVSGCGGGEGPKAPPSTPSSSPVVVALVIDQFPAWIAEERVGKLPKDGFFARMRREGTWAKTMRYPYALTDTAPGHASLHTGKVPSESHILVNSIPDDKTGARTSFFRDAATKLVTPGGVLDAHGSSAKVLAVETVADRLRAERPGAKVLSFSLKDRAALLPAGKRPTHALWYEPSKDTFATSTAIAPAFPAWAAPIADKRAIERARAETWTLFDASFVAENVGATKDAAPGEGDLQGLGTTFPHRASNAWAFRATPMADRMVLDLALAGVKAERDPKEPLLLLVSLSTSDVVGHTFGPSSWEAWDHLRRLDVALARFLDALEAMTGPASVLVSADHGSVVMPEARPGCVERDEGDPYERPCGGGGRLSPDGLRLELIAEVAAATGRSDVVAGVSDGYVFLTAAGRGLDVAQRTLADAAVRRVLLERHKADVAEVYDVRDFTARCPAALAAGRGVPERAKPGEDVLVLVCRSWAPNAGAGDYYVLPSHGSFWDGEIVPGKGTSHGTPYLYDRTVPLFVRGPGVQAGAVITDPVDFTAYAALEASLLGIDARAPSAILSELTARR